MIRTPSLRLLFAVAALLAFAGRAAATPAIQHWTTANGARVYFVSAHELPVVDLRVVFAAGSARDGEQPGLASLTVSLLDQGAGGLSAQQLAERLDGVGAQLAGDSLRDMGLVSLRTLSDPASLNTAVTTFATLLAHPDFPAEALERQRARMLVALKEEQQKPGEIAEKAFFHALYGSHPYASPPSGSEKSLAAIGRDDVVRFHRRFYVGNNAVVAIMGDLDRAAAEALAEQAVGALPAGERAAPLPAPAALTKGSAIHFPHPSTQTHILIGEPAMRRGDPDFFALHLGNHILGGNGLVSRLSEEIREQRGLAYSVYSYFAPMAAEGPFVMGMQTRNDQADAAAGLLRENLQRFIADGPTAEELAAAKKNITGGFPLQLDSNQKITQYLAMIGFYDLPLDYLDTFTARIEAVTAEQVRDAFRRRVDPARLVQVTVGGGGRPVVVGNGK